MTLDPEPNLHCAYRYLSAFHEISTQPIGYFCVLTCNAVILSIRAYDARHWWITGGVRLPTCPEWD